MPFCRHPLPTRAFAGGYPYPSAGSPTPPAPAALLPRPHRGAGSVRGDTWWAAVSGVEPVDSRARFFAGLPPCTGPWGYRHGGWGRRGGGTRSPSPVSNAPELCTSHRSSPPAFLRGIPHTSAGSPHPTHAFGRRYPYPSAGTPHPARTFGAPPPPPPGTEAVRGDIRRATVSGVEPDGQPCQVLRRQFC